MSDGGIESKFLMSIDISFEPPVVTIVRRFIVTMAALSE